MKLLLVSLMLGNLALASAVPKHNANIDSLQNLDLFSSEYDGKHLMRNGNRQASCGSPAVAPNLAGCPALGIINGTEAVPHSWPWMVELTIQKGAVHQCGGALINNEWVVTAAHCGIIPNDHVILGRHDRFSLTEGILDTPVGQVFNHPDYRRVNVDYDIALIKLQFPLPQFRRNVSPVCLATSDDFPFPRPGTACVATGWGYTTPPPGRVLAEKLQQGCGTIITNQSCKNQNHPLLTDRHICTESSGSVICNGDSGGPLVCRKNGRWTLVGISSASVCDTGEPPLFSRVSELRAWIDQTIAAN